MLRRFAFGLCLFLAGCDCSGTDIPPGSEGAPCDTADDCDGELACSDGVCARVVTGDAGPTGDDSSVPRPDTGPVCPTASRCGTACCQASEECVDGECLAACASGLRCGPDSACCADGDLCIDDACVAPGEPCEELIDCDADEYCDLTLGRCLPQSDTRCEFHPTPGEITPALEWRWPEAGAAHPASVHVMMTPVVGDLTADGIPEVAFITYTGSAYTSAGVMRVHRGDTGAELFTVDTPTVCGSTGIALGDLDGDGVPEIVTAGPCAGASRILAFDNEGNHLWSSVTSDGSPFSMSIDYGAPALADLEGDGFAEIVLTGTVIEHDGTLRFSHRSNARSVGVPYDVDGDGDLEVLAPNGVWHHDGTPLWDTPTLPNGIMAVADFFEDGRPDIVVVSGSSLSVYRAIDGERVWGPIAQVGGGNGGPPTVADFDGDGLPEIGIAGANAYAVYDPDGDAEVLWQSPTEDNSSSLTGSSVFDFDGDGSAEVVYNDECAMRIYQGRDGTILAEVDNASHTRIEYPVIVDVDADGNTEIVFAANAATPACSQIASDPGYTGYEPGIRVYGDAADNWVGTRRVWNQHGYSITHIREDLRVPAVTAPNHERFNNFRQNPQSFDAPDLVPGDLEAIVSGCPGTMTLAATVTNDGAAPVGPGLEVSFYVGPEGSGRLVGTAATTTLLVPGASERVMISFAPTAADLDADISWYVVVDDGGDGAGAQNECREDNNRAAATFRCNGLG